MEPATQKPTDNPEVLYTYLKYWDWPKVLILGTAQMDFGLWGQECVLKIQIKYVPEEELPTSTTVQAILIDPVPYSFLHVSKSSSVFSNTGCLLPFLSQ